MQLDDASAFSAQFLAETMGLLSKLDTEAIGTVARLLYETKERDGQIFFFGNGGSHSIATHLACDFGKGTKQPGRPDLKMYRVFALDNAAWITAQANDGPGPFLYPDRYPGRYSHGYDGVFVGQMENFIRPGDVAFAISSSGNSPNVVNALKFARVQNAVTVALVGFDGGEAGRIADHCICVKTQPGRYGLVEGVHEVVHHLLYEYAIALEERAARG